MSYLANRIWLTKPKKNWPTLSTLECRPLQLLNSVWPALAAAPGCPSVPTVAGRPAHSEPLPGARWKPRDRQPRPAANLEPSPMGVDLRRSMRILKSKIRSQYEWIWYNLILVMQYGYHQVVCCLATWYTSKVNWLLISFWDETTGLECKPQRGVQDRECLNPPIVSPPAGQRASRHSCACAQHAEFTKAPRAVLQHTCPKWRESSQLNASQHVAPRLVAAHVVSFPQKGSTQPLPRRSMALDMQFLCRELGVNAMFVPQRPM